MTIDLVASDPWHFVGSDGSNAFLLVSAKQRTGPTVDTFSWVLDFGGRTSTFPFFGLRCTGANEDGMLSCETFEFSLTSLLDAQGDPVWRGGRAA